MIDSEEVYTTIELPKEKAIKFSGVEAMSDWECELFGMGNAIKVRPSVSNVPNVFWRWMQFVCFGNRWRRIR